MRADLLRLKKEGFNAIRCGYHPRKARLYELCDEVGLLVCDEVGLDTALTGDNRAVGGALVNNPNWVEAYLARVENAHGLSRNYTGVILYSLGQGPGVGYNNYKSYLEMKELERMRPVMYEPAVDIWCNDPKSWQGGF
jgi:beta-galactosidase